MAHGVQRVLALRHAAQICAIMVALCMTACTSERTVKPVIPGQVPRSQFEPLAFTADINLRAGRVTIAPPAAAGPGVPTLSLEGPAQPILSLLGAEAVRLVPSNYQASQVGAFAPNKIRVTFDVTIENKLPYVALTTPTWPQPPAVGVILFPLDYVVTTTPGDVTGGGGNGVIVEQPVAGAIVPSVDWNGTGATGSGSPFSFFNDVGCTAATSDECFRWEAYDLTIQPTSGSSTRTVGFDIDASVAQFRTRMIVAADLKEATLLAPARVSGLVTSSLGGPLSGVRVTATTGQSVTTTVSGTYTLNGLTPGAIAVVLSNLPVGCTIPPAQPLSLAEGGSAVADFLVTCAAQTGIITGTLVSSPGGAPVVGATVIASTGGSAVTSASGAFSIPAAGAGSGTLSVSNLLAGCSITPVPFVLQFGGALTVDLVAACPAPVGTGNQ